MIFVDRQGTPEPRALQTPRAQSARERLRAMLGSTGRKHQEQLRASFEPSIWLGCQPALVALFHGKCAYCESPLQATGGGDVEHFRPKALPRGDSTTPARHLYYAWLAYEWHNLLLACRECNARKRDLFPVEGARARMLASVADCRAQEQPLLLDPCWDRPQEHLRFTREGHCLGLTPRGQATVDLLALDRPALVAARQARLATLALEVESLLALPARRAGGASDPARRLSAFVGAQAPYAQASRQLVLALLGELQSRPAAGSSAALRQLTGSVQSADWFEPGLALQATAPASRRKARAAPRPPQHFGGRHTLPARARSTLSRIELRNFKGIEQLSVDLCGPPAEAADRQGCLVLLGENAAGKSTVLEALTLAVLGTTQIGRLGLKGQDFIRRDAAWQPLRSAAEIALCFDGEAEPAVRLSIDARSGRFRGPAQPQCVLLGYGTRRYFTPRRRRRHDPEPAARVATLFDPATTLPNPTSWLMNCSERDFNAVVRALRPLLLLPDEAFVQRPPRGQRKGASLTIQLQGVSTPLERLSEGYRTVVTTAVDIMRELLAYWPDLEQAQGLVLVDELDTHLHPRWKMRILQRLREALPRVQFVVTTHDPLCLRGAYDGEVQVLMRDEANRIDRLVELPNVQGLSVVQLLTSPFFGLMSTEDPAFERDLMRHALLGAKAGRSAEEEAELAGLRETTRQRLRLGRSPQEQLVVEAATVALQQESQDGRHRFKGLRPAALQSLADTWARLRQAPGDPA